MESTSNVIALLTDFGLSDPYVGSMKASIVSINPEVEVIDISHGVSAQNVSQAAFLLETVYRDYPTGTIFTTVVDPGVGSGRKALLVSSNKYFFIAPNNGLLSFILKRNKVDLIIELTNPTFFKEKVSATFHGRDIFAPCAAHLAKGHALQEFGEQMSDTPLIIESLFPLVADNRISGKILHTDHFGNLISNIRREDLDLFLSQSHKQLEIRIEGCKFDLVNHYAEGKDMPAFALIGSSGYLEISSYCRSAAEELGLSLNANLEIRASQG